MSIDLPPRDGALCAEVDTEIFFPEKGGSSKEAKQLCSTCDNLSLCLEYALAHRERFGIWGGSSERERRRIALDRGISWDDEDDQPWDDLYPEIAS